MGLGANFVYRSGVSEAKVLFGPLPADVKRWRQVSLVACDVTSTMPLYYAHAHNATTNGIILLFYLSLSLSLSVPLVLFYQHQYRLQSEYTCTLVYNPYWCAVWYLTYIYVYKAQEAHGTLQILNITIT